MINRLTVLAVAVLAAWKSEFFQKCFVLRRNSVLLISIFYYLIYYCLVLLISINVAAVGCFHVMFQQASDHVGLTTRASIITDCKLTRDALPSHISGVRCQILRRSYKDIMVIKTHQIWCCKVSRWRDLSSIPSLFSCYPSSLPPCTDFGLDTHPHPR